MCIVREMAVPAILRLMPLVMKGKHHNVKGVTLDGGKSITIKANLPTAVHTDGEILGEAITSLRVSIKPKALRTVVGPGFPLTK